MISEGTVAFFNLATAASAALGSIAQWLQSNLLHPGIPIRYTLTPQLITFSPSLPACSSAPSAVTIVLAVIGSVVLIGIILLALWKLLVTIHDRREFDRFQSERSRARYEMVSLEWGCCRCMGGLLGCTGSKQLCSEREGWQARGMQVSMPCGAFQGPACRTAFSLASYKCSAKLYPAFGSIIYFPAELEAGGGRGDCGGSQTGQVCEGALLGGFGWGCSVFEGSASACRQDGRWV